jgi:hypothetical protein
LRHPMILLVPRVTKPWWFQIHALHPTTFTSSIDHQLAVKFFFTVVSELSNPGV